MASTVPSRPSLLSAFLFATSSTAWWFFERYAQMRFDGGLPTYNMRIETLSDLGVDYRQVHPLKHHNVHSYAHPTMNFIFFIAGACYGLGNLTLLWTSRRTATREATLSRTARLVLSILCAAGFGLMGAIHGGPREKFWGTIGWHWNGFALVGVAGNLVSLLVGVLPAVAHYERLVHYRLFSFGLGIAGLYSHYRFWTIEEWDFESPLGMWQRGSIYPVLAWQGLTALTVVYANLTTVPKDKES